MAGYKIATAFYFAYQRFSAPLQTWRPTIRTGSVPIVILVEVSRTVERKPYFGYSFAGLAAQFPTPENARYM